MKTIYTTSDKYIKQWINKEINITIQNITNIPIELLHISKGLILPSEIMYLTGEDCYIFIGNEKHKQYLRSNFLHVIDEDTI